MEDIPIEDHHQEATPKKAPVASSTTGSTTIASKFITKKEAKELEKWKKQARIVTAQTAAAKIFTLPSSQCEKCMDLQEVQHLLHEKEGLLQNLQKSHKRTVKDLEIQLKAKKLG